MSVTVSASYTPLYPPELDPEAVEVVVEEDIPVTVVNETGKSDFTIAVFAKNTSPNVVSTPFIAWHTIRAQSSSQFVYPQNVQVVARYCEEYVVNQSGPFEAEPGTTWRLMQRTRECTPNLVWELNTMNDDRSIVVKNIKPNSWPGRTYDFYIFKNNRPLMLETYVGVGCQAYFHLDPNLYFGVANNITRGSIIPSLASLHAHFKVDLRNYPSGVVVTLNLDQASGRFMFSAVHNAENVGAPPL